MMLVTPNGLVNQSGCLIHGLYGFIRTPLFKRIEFEVSCSPECGLPIPYIPDMAICALYDFKELEGGSE